MSKKWTSGGIAAVLFLYGLAPVQAAMPLPQPQTPPVELAPHRAIYDMSLGKAVAGANISDVRGRLVFDFSGSACEGYALNTRLVTEIVDRDGKEMVTDLRSSTWEHAKGERFRFNSSQYLNQRLSEQVVGLASRGKDAAGVNISIEKPKKRQVKLGGSAMFPTQHSLAVLDAAQRGRSLVQANIYDGSEKGAKYFETTTFIGNPFPPGGNAGFKTIPNSEKLDDLVSWPVSISYFETKEDGGSDEGTPTYELSFRLYANGVSRKLQIDYGNFSIAGELSRIDFFEPAKCVDSKKEKTP
jgi:EipB-like